MRKQLIWAFGMLLMMTVSANAANIALFSDTNYIDYDPTFTDSDSEGSNLQATLEAAGHTVTPFTGTTAAEWSAALAGADILVIPEQENGAIAPDLEVGAVTAIQNFVAGGGGLLITDDYEDFLNDVFGYSIVNTGGGDDPYSYNAAAAAGTAFEGGPASLPYNNDTESFNTLPGSASCIYESGSGNCAVILITEGSGQIISLGYDWYDAAPIGAQDSGWIPTADNAAAQLASGAGAVSVPTMNEWGKMALVLFFGIASMLLIRRRKNVFSL